MRSLVPLSVWPGFAPFFFLLVYVFLHGLSFIRVAFFVINIPNVFDIMIIGPVIVKMKRQVEKRQVIGCRLWVMVMGNGYG